MGEDGNTKLGEYHDLYLKTDVFLLADVVENFRTVLLKNYLLDPAWFLTAPSFFWCAMLKMTGVKLELICEEKSKCFDSLKGKFEEEFPQFFTDCLGPTTNS